MLNIEKGNCLTSDSFKNIPNTPENREDFLQYPREDLTRLKEQAIATEDYETAAFIRDILKDKENQKDENPIYGNIKVEIGSILNTTEKKEGIPKNTEPNKDDETLTTTEKTSKNHEYVKLWLKQGEISKKLKEYRGLSYEIPRTWINIDGNNFIIDQGEYCGFYKEVDGKYEKIQILEDKISNNSKIENIDSVGKYYRVTVSEEKQKKHFVVNKEGDLLPELGDQTGSSYFSICDRYGPSVKYYYTTRDIETEKSITLYFDENMKEINPDELENAPLLIKCGECVKLDEERLKTEYGCVFKKDKKDNNIFNLENTNGEILFSFPNGFTEIFYEYTSLYISNGERSYTIDFGSKINNPNLILINSPASEKKGFAININKETNNKEEFELYNAGRGCGMSFCGAFIGVCSNNEYLLYDENFNKLGKYRQDDENIVLVEKSEGEEKGENRGYIYSKKTGKLISEYLIERYQPIYNVYYHSGKSIYIFKTPDGKFSQFEL